MPSPKSSKRAKAPAFEPQQLDLLATADLQRDLEEALDAYATVEQQVLDDLPLVPLWFSTVGVAMDENITAGMDGRGLLDWASVERS